MRLCPFCFMKLLLTNCICMIPLFVYLLYWYCIVPVICSAIHFQKSVPFFVKFQQLLVSALLSGALAFNANSLNDVRWSGQGLFPVRKRTGTLRIWRARAYLGVWGQGAKPPEAEGILLPKRANMSLSFIKFCSYMPKRTGTAFRCVPARNEPWLHFASVTNNDRENATVVANCWLTAFPLNQAQ